jgi:predicted dehydrogenase
LIRWGIWGTGRQAHELALDFVHVPGAVLHAAASRSADRAFAFAQRHRIALHYEGLAALLATSEIDIVYVVSPNGRHLEDCLACIDAGKAVVCEKPFALNAAQTERIIATARQRGVFCMEAMWTRFVPAVREAKRLVESGRLGRIERIEGDFAYASRPDPADWRFGPTAGALLDRGVYLVSLTQFLLGTPAMVHGTARLGGAGVDEHSSYQLCYTDGATAHLWASMTATGRNEFVITGTQGALRLHAPFYRAHRVNLRIEAPADPLRPKPPSLVPTFKDRLRDASIVKTMGRRFDLIRNGRVAIAADTFMFPGNGYQFELQEATRCVQSGALESKVMPLDDTLAVMRTIDRLRAHWADYPATSSTP